MFQFANLDNVTRKFMVEAIEEANATENIYFSTRFTPAGQQNWVRLLTEAALNFDEHWLAFQIESLGLMNNLEVAMLPKGGYTTKHVPQNASQTLAEGQFNRFYILGLCKRARAEGKTTLEIYRAKYSADPRPESIMLIGTTILVTELERQLKTVANSFLSNLVKPNSGLSVKLI
jgi:hypothetical protein